MTTSITVGAINADVASQATDRLGVLLERSRRGTGARPLAPYGLPVADTGRQPERGTALLAFTNMLEAAAEATGLDHLGLEMARVEHAQETGLLKLLTAHAPTVGRALEDWIRFFPSVQTGTAVALVRRNGTAVLSYRIQDPSITHSLQDSAFTLGRLYRRLKEASGPDWRVDHVTMASSAPRAAGLYGSYFEAPVSFEAGMTALCFPVSVLAVPIRTANARRYADLCEDMRRRTHARGEADLLEEALGAWILHAPRRSGVVSLEQAAADFGISVRTLQRRLNDLGLSFSDLRSRVRMEVARRWLADSAVSVSHIGQELGFSETSAFTRAFRSYTQQSPRAFRRAAAQPA